MTSRVLAITGKEIRDTIRDRRALFVMMVLPMLFYPVVIVGFLQVSRALKQKLDKETMRVWIAGEERLPVALLSAIRADRRLEVQGVPTADEDAEERLKDGDAELLLRVDSSFLAAIEAETPAPLLVIYQKSRDKSLLALDRLKRITDAWSAKVRAARLRKRGLSEAAFEPLAVEEKNLGRDQVALIRSLSMMLIILGLTGAFYPALDLGAGEKERGTLETLLLTPTVRADIAWGKYLAVILVASVAGMLNVASLAMTFMNIGALAGKDMPPLLTIDSHVVLGMAAALLPLIALFSGLALAISTWAASYREGQNYLSPLMMAVVVPAMAAGLPGVTLTPAFCMVPVMGSALLFRELLSGTGTLLQVGLVTSANLFYAWLALRGVASLYGQESVLMRPAAAGSNKPLIDLKALFQKRETFDWSSLPAELRPGPRLPILPHALVLFGAAFALIWFLVPRLRGDTPALAFAIEGLGLGALAVLASLIGRWDLRATLRLAPGSLWSLLAGLLCGLGAALFSVELDNLVTQLIGFDMSGLDAEFLARLKTLREFFEGSLVLLILCYAILPGLGEELLLRGPMLRSFESSGFGRWTAIAAATGVGVLLHFSPEKALGLALIGVLAGLLASRSGAILPAILCHAAARLGALGASRSRAELLDSGLFRSGDMMAGELPLLRLTTTGLAVAGALVLAGLAVLFVKGPGSTPTADAGRNSPDR